jgi:DNA modification methylase
MTAVVLRGDARHLPLPDASVDLIVTSPPYFGLRSYTDGGEHYAGQIGSEATPAEFLAALWACTAEWVRVLKPSGSLFVNLGDKYNSAASNQQSGTVLAAGRSDRLNTAQASGQITRGRGGVFGGTQPKSLLGLPWRYALGATDQLGLILRAEIIWAKPNGLPESVTDRVRRAHEQVFHFTRQPRYYAAVDEIREPQLDPNRRGPDSGSTRRVNGGANQGFGLAGAFQREYNPLGKLPGSVWTIPSAPLTVPARLGVDHFAAFPPALVRPVVAGWSPPGICLACGEGRRPVTHVERISLRPGDRPGVAKLNGDGAHGFDRRAGTHILNQNTITGYVCACAQPTAPTRPALVVDPFGGTGTTALVASGLGRTGVSVDLSADYCRLARWRVSDPGERARALDVPKPPPVMDGQDALFEVGVSP